MGRDEILRFCTLSAGQQLNIALVFENDVKTFSIYALIMDVQQGCWAVNVVPNTNSSSKIYKHVTHALGVLQMRLCHKSP